MVHNHGAKIRIVEDASDFELGGGCDSRAEVRLRGHCVSGRLSKGGPLCVPAVGQTKCPVSLDGSSERSSSD